MISQIKTWTQESKLWALRIKSNIVFHAVFPQTLKWLFSSGVEVAKENSFVHFNTEKDLFFF